MNYTVEVIIALIVIMAVLVLVRLYQARRQHEEMYRAILDLAEMIGDSLD